MNFVFFSDASQDADRFGHRWFIHDDLCESSFERGIRLNVLPVFRERCCTNAPQLTYCRIQYIRPA